MKVIRWTLGDVLAAEGITPYALGQVLGRGRQKGLYALLRAARAGEAASTGLPLAADILTALEKLSGREIQLSEVLTWEERPDNHRQAEAPATR